MKRTPNHKLLILFLHIIFANTFMLQAQINTKLPVGAISGTVDVTPTGAATYTIPIEVVPGTQGMQPNLSISYNSMGSMGLLGLKWNLSGLTSISRCGKMLYYGYWDGDYLTSIKFSQEDRFMMDGNRLLSKNFNCGAVGAHYTTEMVNFTTIISNGGTNGHPESFTAYTDDGSIIEYGNTTNSKQTLGATNSNTVLSWLVSKMTDAEGNYMTFHYGKDNGTKEYWIDSIKYTGNSGLQPYAKVQFEYITNTLNKDTYFVGVYAIPQTKLLKYITVSYQNSVVRKYEFTYNLNDPGETTAHLKEVVLHSENCTNKLNATTFTWGEPNKLSKAEQKKLFNYTYERFVTGDFNGDGTLDYVAYGLGAARDTWKLYTGVPGTDNFVFSMEGSHRPLYYFPKKQSCFFYVADVNGDGCDELIIAEMISNSDLENYYYRIISTNSNPPEIAAKAITYVSEMLFGNFYGEGGTDIAFVKKQNNYYSLEFLLNGYFSGENLIDSVLAPCRIRVVDFDGDGQSEIEVSNAERLLIYKYDYFEDKFKSKKRLPSVPTVFDRYSGDFNGDGITDLLTYDWTQLEGLRWQLYIGKGDGSYTSPTRITELNNAHDVLPNGRYVPRYKVLIADISGDGKDDIIQPFYFVENFKEKTLLNVVYSKGYYDNVYKYSNKKDTIMPVYKGLEYFSIVDVNRDGVLDILIQDSIPYPTFEPYVIYLYKNNRYEFIKEIKDGIGKTTKFTYNFKYLRAESITYYTAKHTCTRIKRYMLPLVNSVLFSNGLNQDLNTITYQFENPMFSFRKKSFLGFKKFTSINTQENRKDVTSFELDTYSNQWFGNREILLPVSQLSYVNNQLISQTIHSNEIKNINYYYYVVNSSSVNVEDYLSNTRTVTSNILNADGRLVETNTKTYNNVNTNPSFLAHSRTNTNKYYTITLNGNQKKTVPTQVITTQQYGATGIVIADTTSYGYSPTEKGRLKLKCQGNIDGSISTSYEYLNPTGVCTLKTVSAAGCAPRTEKYEYDATRRFVTKITNPLNHSANFTYDAQTGNKLKETNANSLATTYIYDSFGQLKQINHPDGTITKDTIYWCYRPSPLNAQYCTKTTTTGQPELIVYYDILGREVCRLDDGNYYDTRYNDKGQVTQTSYPYTKLTDPDNSKTWSNFEYDNFGRKNYETAPYCTLSYTYNNRKVTVTDHLRNISTWKNYDALGITETEDPGGTITYTYSVISSNNKPRHRTQITSNGATTTIETDLWGNRLELIEPNAGTITSEYNKFNELKKQTDANGNITLYTYDRIGRVTSENFTDNPNHVPNPPSVVYTYDTGNKALGKVSTIEVDGKLSEKYTYDNFGRVASKYHNIGTFYYTYNQNGQLQQLKYPGGNFAVNYNYTTAGKLKEIRRSSDNTLIYKVNTRNKYQQPTNVTYGSSRIMPIATQYKYNDFGIITGIITTVGMQSDTIDPWGGTGGTFDDRGNGTVMNYVYGYNEKGLMTSRTDNTVNQNESYVYDNLDRLTKNTYYDYNGKKVAQTFKYQPNGNILSNSQVGEYSYDPVKKHAVTQIECPNPDLISENRCDVVYNRFNQPTKITEGDRLLSHQIELSYGANRQRSKAVFKENDTVVSTHYYSNKYYERVKDAEGNVFYHHYIYGDGGVVALHIAKLDNTIQEDTLVYDPGIDEPIILRTTDTTDVIYYIHTDHLGSYCALTDAKGNVVQRNCFDPWGNYAFDKWYICTITHPRGDTLTGLSFPITRRGFTGHEHYPQFKIINMNGRLYDPVISRFFSPDMFVANASFTQDFNRYSYCRNNPLHYTDPTGQKIDGYAIWSFIMFPVFLPARLFSEAFTWIDDKINGNTRHGGYFQPGYMTGQTGPGTLTPYSSVNTINYGEPGYIHQKEFVDKNMMGKGYSIGADNQGLNITARPIILTLSKRFLYSACKKLGIDPGKPIPEEFRNAAFVYAAKSLWFSFAPNPSLGFDVTKIVNSYPGLTQALWDDNTNLTTGDSKVFLDRETAFTSLSALFLTLGHELVHVSQYKLLAGTETDLIRSPNFQKMLEYNADVFEHFIGGGFPRYTNMDFKSLFPDHYKLVDYKNFPWIHFYESPF